LIDCVLRGGAMTAADNAALRATREPCGTQPVGLISRVRSHRRLLAAPAPPTRKDRLLLVVWLLLISAVALAARLVAHGHSYELFIDEVSYVDVARNLATGHGLVLFGGPFDLHPPAMFAVLALVISVFSSHGPLARLVLELRPVDAVFGAATCVAVFLLVRRVASTSAAVAAGLLLALDPFMVRFDSRVLLEAPAQAWTVGMILLVVAAVRPAATTSGDRVASRAAWLLVAAGICGAWVITTKESYAFVTVLPLLVLLATGWVLSRREVATTLGVALGGYGLYVLLVAASGGIGAWWQQKSSGILRIVGVNQVTGFNAPEHVSLTSRLAANSGSYAVTYALMLLGFVGSLVLVARLRPWSKHSAVRADIADRRLLLVVVWQLAASAYLAYATAFGTIEEQMYYMLLVPSAVTACLAVTELKSGIKGKVPRLAVIGLVVVALAFDGGVWTLVHTRKDDGYLRLLTWSQTQLPPGSVVSATEGTAQFLLRGVTVGDWSDLAQLRAHRVDYVVLSTTLVNQHYGSASLQFQKMLDRSAPVVFSANGPTLGWLRVYDVRQLSGALPGAYRLGNRGEPTAHGADTLPTRRLTTAQHA